MIFLPLVPTFDFSSFVGLVECTFLRLTAEVARWDASCLRFPFYDFGSLRPYIQKSTNILIDYLLQDLYLFSFMMQYSLQLRNMLVSLCYLLTLFKFSESTKTNLPSHFRVVIYFTCPRFSSSSCTFWLSTLIRSLDRARINFRGSTILKTELETTILSHVNTMKLVEDVSKHFNWCSTLNVAEETSAHDILLHLVNSKYPETTTFILANSRGIIFGNQLNDVSRLLVGSTNVLSYTNLPTPSNKMGAILRCIMDNSSCSGALLFSSEMAKDLSQNGRRFENLDITSEPMMNCDHAKMNAYGEIEYVDAFVPHGSLRRTRRVPLIVGASDGLFRNCRWMASLLDQFPIRAAPGLLKNTFAKTRSKWNKLGLGTERWQSRHHFALNSLSRRPDLFLSKSGANQSHADSNCNANRRDVIFGVYNYADPAALYRWLRSLRESGSTCDVVVFTHMAHKSLLIVAKKYGASILEYFAPLTDNVVVANIMMRPHMQALKRQFTAELIKNYKFTFMYCYLIEFGDMYRRAAFMDIRDIYFQKDPFLGVPCDGLTAYTETSSLLVRNRDYIYRDHYPKHCKTNWENFQNLPPLNSGGFLADVTTMKEIVKLSDQILVECGPGFDQGTFNEIIYNKMLSVKSSLFTTELGPVAMICNSLTVQTNNIQEICNEMGNPFSIVHQFDRFRGIADLYTRKYPFNASEFIKFIKT